MGQPQQATAWRMLVLLNRKSGTMRTLGAEHVVDRVRQTLSPVCASLQLEVIDGVIPDGIAAKIEAGEYNCIVAGGGDGTISSLASRLSGTDIALGALPLGTMNMIVRVLGFPPQFEPALAALATAVAQRIDLGDVNGETFVRQVSFGLQPRIARIREKIGYSSRTTKLLAGFRALAAVLLSSRNLHLVASLNGERTALRSPAVIVSNNEILGGERLLVQDSLDSGVLGLYALPPLGLIALTKLTMAILSGRWQQDPDLKAEVATAVKLSPPRQGFQRPAHILCSFDGELRSLDFPVAITIRPKSLTVLMPAAADKP